eukprot:746501-Hanusia_phi.AAC.2
MILGQEAAVQDRKIKKGDQASAYHSPPGQGPLPLVFSEAPRNDAPSQSEAAARLSLGVIQLATWQLELLAALKSEISRRIGSDRHCRADFGEFRVTAGSAAGAVP